MALRFLYWRFRDETIPSHACSFIEALIQMMLLYVSLTLQSLNLTYRYVHPRSGHLRPGPALRLRGGKAQCHYHHHSGDCALHHHHFGGSTIPPTQVPPKEGKHQEEERGLPERDLFDQNGKAGKSMLEKSHRLFFSSNVVSFK
ncbi:hypothetical protein CEXT_233261 [Caerostris extrusa]|uniref:Uncharacterized protein n=1 Tax=Caerostris extrusa TaxID=172846 RepID=A0AAV4XXV6_CAEEX|nr:hypothetical protein CEXT_233261 [Caerostris extrusa]